MLPVALFSHAGTCSLLSLTLSPKGVERPKESQLKKRRPFVQSPNICHTTPRVCGYLVHIRTNGEGTHSVLGDFIPEGELC